MRKITLAAAAVIFMSAFASAQANWAIGFKAGMGQNQSDIGDIAKAQYPSYSREMSNNVYGIEFLVEDDSSFLSEGNFIGFKTGFSWRGYETARAGGYSYKAGYSEMLAALYYKRMVLEKIGLIIGGGGAWGIAYGGDYPYKIYPFATVGAEWRIARFLALGLDVKYNFLAEMKSGGIVYRDVSGFEPSLALRLYLY